VGHVSITDAKIFMRRSQLMEGIMTEKSENNDLSAVSSEAPGMSRRKLLMRLGLAAGAVYAAPVMLQLNPAKASGVSRGSRPSRPSRASRPSRPSRASRPSGPSRPSARRGNSGRGSRPSRPRYSRPSRPSNRSWEQPVRRYREDASREVPRWLTDLFTIR
jgi:hypothetical protein